MSSDDIDDKCDYCLVRDAIAEDMFGFSYCYECWSRPAPTCPKCDRVLPKPDCCEEEE